MLLLFSFSFFTNPYISFSLLLWSYIFLHFLLLSYIFVIFLASNVFGFLVCEPYVGSGGALGGPGSGFGALGAGFLSSETAEKKAAIRTSETTTGTTESFTRAHHKEFAHERSSDPHFLKETTSLPKRQTERQRDSKTER